MIEEKKTVVQMASSRFRDFRGHRTITSIVLLYGLFSVICFALIMIIWKMAKAYSVHLFMEGSALEFTQFLIMFFGMMLALSSAWRNKDFAIIFIIFGLLCAMCAVREVDMYLDAWIPILGWNLPFHMMSFTGIFLIWRNLKVFKSQVHCFVLHRSFGTVWAGFMLAIPFAQMIGHGAFLQALFTENYQRPMKRMIEESAETMGYLIIVLGICDFLFSKKTLA